MSNSRAPGRKYVHTVSLSSAASMSLYVVLTWMLAIPKVNGTACAVPRVLLALLETHQRQVSRGEVLGCLMISSFWSITDLLSTGWECGYTCCSSPIYRRQNCCESLTDTAFVCVCVCLCVGVCYNNRNFINWRKLCGLFVGCFFNV